MSNSNDNKKPTRYNISVASWINWNTKEGAYGCSIVNDDDGSVIFRNFSISSALESSSLAELKALIMGLSHVPTGTPVLIKTSQPSIVAGINHSLEFWEKQSQWQTKEGTTVKHQSEWQELGKLVKGRKTLALQVQDDEFNALQNASKQYLKFISFSEN